MGRVEGPEEVFWGGGRGGGGSGSGDGGGGGGEVMKR